MEPVRIYWGRRNRPEKDFIEENRDWWVGQEGRLMKDWTNCDHELLLTPFLEGMCQFSSDRGGDWTVVPRGVSFQDGQGGRNSIYFQRFHLCENSGTSAGIGPNGIQETIPYPCLAGPSRDPDLVPVSVMVIGSYTPPQSQTALYNTVIDISRWDWNRIQKAFGDKEPQTPLPRVGSQDFVDKKEAEPDAFRRASLKDSQYSKMKVKPLATYMIPPGDGVSPEFMAQSANGPVHLTDSNPFDSFEGVNDFISFLHMERSDYVQVLVTEFGRMLSNLRHPPQDFMVELSGYFTEDQTVMTNLDPKRYLILCHKDDEAVYEYTGMVLGTPIAGTDAPGSKPMLSSAYKSMKSLGRLSVLPEFPTVSQKVFESMAKATRSNALSPEDVYPPLNAYLKHACENLP